jgi:hypothetical protein
MSKKSKATKFTTKVAKGVGKEAVQIGKGVAKEGGKIGVGVLKGFLDVFSPFR